MSFDLFTSIIPKNIDNNVKIKIFLIIIILAIVYFLFFRDVKHTKNTNKQILTDEMLLDELMEKEKLNSLHRFRKKKHKKSKSKKKYVYLEICVGNKNPEKIKIKLFDKIVPRTCNNFRELCKTKKYKNTIFHRIIQDFVIQGGDYENFDGTGGRSIYGETFPDENFYLNHDKSLLLSMANSGPDTNGSQFFITTGKTPHLDGKHVVFGEVVKTQKSKKLIKILNNIETNENDNPRVKCEITDCGIC